MNFKGTRLQKSPNRGMVMISNKLDFLSHFPPCHDFKTFGFPKSFSSLNLGATQSAVIFHRPHTLP